MRTLTTIVVVLIIAGCMPKGVPVRSSDANYQMYMAKGMAAAERGEYQNAVAAFTSAIDRKDTPTARSNRGLAYFRLGQFTQSREDHDRAITLDSTDAGSYVNRAAVLAAIGEIPEALADLDKALELDATNGSALSHRGQLRMALGNFAEALSDLTLAIELLPDDPTTFNDLAWLLATCPESEHRDGGLAVAAARRACETSDNAWHHVDILAAASAEKGEFDKAVETQQKAIESAPEEQRESMRERLTIYQYGRAYRQGPQ